METLRFTVEKVWHTRQDREYVGQKRWNVLRHRFVGESLKTVTAVCGFKTRRAAMAHAKALTDAYPNAF